MKAPVVPRTKQVAAPTVSDQRNGTPPTALTSVPTQITPELPQPAAVPVAKGEKSPTAAAKSSNETAATVENADDNEMKSKTDDDKEKGSSAARSVSQNPLTAIANDRTMILTRQYRQRIRIKYSGERNGGASALNDRNASNRRQMRMVDSKLATTAGAMATKENVAVVPKTKSDKSSAGANSFEHYVKCVDMKDVKVTDGFNAGANTSNHSAQSASVASKAATAVAVRKLKKKSRKIAVTADTKLKIEKGGDEMLFPCRHCGRKYRWKSTLRRHENDECGNKAPSHQCPYCDYKAKQRGNLGVHVRKHHADKPKLESCRKRKTL